MSDTVIPAEPGTRLVILQYGCFDQDSPPEHPVIGWRIGEDRMLTAVCLWGEAMRTDEDFHGGEICVVVHADGTVSAYNGDFQRWADLKAARVNIASRKRVQRPCKRDE